VNEQESVALLIYFLKDGRMVEKGEKEKDECKIIFG